MVIYALSDDISTKANRRTRAVSAAPCCERFFRSETLDVYFGAASDVGLAYNRQAIVVAFVTEFDDMLELAGLIKDEAPPVRQRFELAEVVLFESNDGDA